MKTRVTQSSHYDVRYTEESDAPYLEKWLLEKGELHFFPMSKGVECDQMVKNWIGFARFKSSLTATFKGVPCGIATLFLMPYRKVAHLAMGQIIVSPTMRRGGVGRSLLRNMMHLGKNYFRLHSLHFEILDNSFLIPLLKGEGFTHLFSQDKFVKEGKNYFPRHIFEVDLQGKEKI